MKNDDTDNWKLEDYSSSPIGSFTSDDDSGYFENSNGSLNDFLSRLANIAHVRSSTGPIPNIPQPQTSCNLPSQALANKNLFKTNKRNTNKYIFRPRNDHMANETSEDDQFNQICNDKNHLINPHQLGFIPHDFWPDESFQLGDIVHDFFRRKNHPDCRFSHKLYNALKLTESNNLYFNFTGVEWKSKVVLHVDKIKFARLLGIKSIDGSLFHQQGSFPALGFVQLSIQDFQKHLGDDFIQNSNIEIDHYLIHNPGVFVSDCSEQNVVDNVRWQGIRQRTALCQSK